MAGPTIIDAVKSWFAVKDKITNYNDECLDAQESDVASEKCYAMADSRDTFIHSEVASKLYQLVAQVGAFGPTEIKESVGCNDKKEPVIESKPTDKVCEDPSGTDVINAADIAFKKCIDGILDKIDGRVESDIAGSTELTAVKDKAKEILNAIGELRDARSDLTSEKMKYAKANSKDSKGDALKNVAKNELAVKEKIIKLKNLIIDLEGGKKLDDKGKVNKDTDREDGLLKAFNDAASGAMRKDVDASKLLTLVKQILAFAKTQVGGGGGGGGQGGGFGM